MLLLSLLVFLAAGRLTGTLAGEPPPSDVDDQSELLLHVNDLDHSGPLDAAGSTTTAPVAAESRTTSADNDAQTIIATPEDDSHPTSASEGDAGMTPATVEDGAGTTTATPAEVEVVDGGREQGGQVGIDSNVEINPDTDSGTDEETDTGTGVDVAATTTAEPSGETTTAATGDDDPATTTAAPDDAEPTTAATEGDLTTVAPTPAAAEAALPTEATEDAAETTPRPADEAATTTPGAASTSPTTELSVKLVSGMALRPGEQPLSRHRADPGLGPSETKLSKGRTGVQDLEMLDNQSKPRKGAPPPSVTPAPVMPGGLSATEGVPVTVSVTPGSGASFFGKTSSPTEETGGQEDQTAPKGKAATHPKPTEAKDAAGGDSGPSGSLIAGAVVLVLVFAVIGFFVLRKARESWYRRHYRKMDFLVDGMYNL